ncbi:MAG: hypothetical protein GC134_06425 [Proteobacteria bacterium]|nr:hypothetical protein [Pseudomonadota bacterium]
MAETPTRFGAPRGQRRPEPQKEPEKQRWTDDLAREAYSMIGSGKEGDTWYAERRKIYENVDFNNIFDGINLRIERLGGQRMTPAGARDMVKNNPDIEFLEQKAQAAKQMGQTSAAPKELGDNTVLEQMTQDMRQVGGIVKHFESQVLIAREQVKKQMTPFFEKTYVTSIMAQETFEQVASSHDPIRTMKVRLQETKANMAAVEKVDFDALMQEAKGESRTFAQLALKTYPDLFGELRGKNIPKGLFRKGGPDAERQRAFAAVQDYHPRDFADAELGLAKTEMIAAMVQQKFQQIDGHYRKALEIELMGKLDMYNDIMAQRAGVQPARSSAAFVAPQPEVTEAQRTAPEGQELDGGVREAAVQPQEAGQPDRPDMQMQWEKVPSKDDPSKMVLEPRWTAEAPEQMAEQGQDAAQATVNPHGFKEVKRAHFLSENQIAAAQKRVEKAFPTEPDLAAGENPLGLKVAQRARFMTPKQLETLQKRFAKNFPAQDGTTKYVPMHTVLKEERAAAKAEREARKAAKLAEQGPVEPVQTAPEVAVAQPAAPAVQEPTAAPQPQAEVRDNTLRADRSVPPRNPDMPELRATRDEPEVLGRAPAVGGVTREEAEAAGKGHLYKGDVEQPAPEAPASELSGLSFEELRERSRDLDARIQAARERHDNNPAVGTDKWWEKGGR